ncbi:MAG: ribonuclease P protein component [Demequina sp.]|nr:ribonuclease P protein component [Demequina sp.]
MLSASHRIRRGEDFRLVMRTGAKAGTRTAVVYLVRTGDAQSMTGFAVSRAVGGAVVRNRVTRRFRAIMADELNRLPHGSRVVLRALPASASASFDELKSDVVGGLRRAVAKADA